MSSKLLNIIQEENISALATLLDQKDYSDNDLLHSIYYATHNGKLNSIKLFKDKLGYLPEINYLLVIASEEEYLHLIEYLLQECADINYCDGEPLRRAAMKGKLDSIKLLLDKGAKLHDNNGHCRALEQAVYSGYSSIVRYLLEKGANVNSVDECDILQVYLHWEKEILDLLSKYGLQFEDRETLLNKELSRIIMNNDYGEVKKLIKYGADINSIPSHVIELIMHDRKYNKILKLVESYREQRYEEPKEDILLKAIKSQDITECVIVLNKGANIRNNNYEPLKEALATNNRDIVELLLKYLNTK
ncbi:Ankyrin-repeat protein [Orpheovirus IHUMI-LCC2]|uniref:Ankyrin-repeat protein n=1 Tax=Orpheovirus IHUMI-LCC2 TaxID=2023057 RepID=A0A2I2L5Y0_9VIRU|nr:Ankyrin-repeat protein [Orpheovirus IHUMI-LCC2]SNW62859.1 Ankyrin-repeat protein [Orpheovirus IHUMI-LCC2]